MTDRDRPDVLHTPEDGPVARYDRVLTLEVWYPAAASPGGRTGGDYQTTAFDPAIAVALHGRASRDAAPASGGPFPLVVISHGYPGNRLLMSPLGENLASKGFVVASIDHPDSTYGDRQAFASTLYNRSPDQLFVVERAGADRRRRIGQPAGWAHRRGTYGHRRLLDGRLRRGQHHRRRLHRRVGDRAGRTADQAPRRADRRQRRLPRRTDPRIVAAIAIGPWGMQRGYWDAEGLAAIRTPVLFVAGDADDVSGYANGDARDLRRRGQRRSLPADVRQRRAQRRGADAAAVRGARRRRGAAGRPFAHYADPVWDSVRMNNILQHFATAWFDLHLKGDRTRAAYLDVVPDGRTAVFAVDRDGTPTAAHTYWKGFQRGTAVGLRLEHALPAGPGGRGR